MKINEAMALAMKNKKGRIYPKSNPNITLVFNHLTDDWGYDNIISNDVKDGYHRTKIARHYCPDTPPIIFNLVEALS